MRPLTVARQYLSKLWRLKFVQFFIPSTIFCKWEYKHHMGKKINLKNPKTFNEKLQWLKLYNRNPIYTRLVDKYEARQYIKEKIGDKYLVELIGVYKSVEEIPFDHLPKEYVLKCNHDSGTVIIKNSLNHMSVEEIKQVLQKGMKKNYYYEHREWPYKNVKPRIICERYLACDVGELMDYKFMCFGGEPKCLFLCLDRHNGKGLKVDFYDMEWNQMPFERHYPCSGRFIHKPACFDKMVELARKLSKDLPFVRVDLYENNGNIYFGELTFYPGSGLEEFKPDSYDELLGSWISLPSHE